MLTKVKAYGSPIEALTMHLSDSDSGKPETDLIQIRNIDGLDPVKASVSLSPYGSVDGESLTGTSVQSRNIVLTLGPNPDWGTWTHSNLRRLLYSYFTPKRSIRLEFHSDDLDPVEISGVVETAENNMFSKDPEFQVSIICPSPYFTTIDPVVITGQTGDSPITVEYNGGIENGINVKVVVIEAPFPEAISIQVINSEDMFVDVSAGIDTTKYLEVNSTSLQKFARLVLISNGNTESVLGSVNEGGEIIWPIFEPGENEFSVDTDVGTHDWTLTYYERYGGL